MSVNKKLHNRGKDMTVELNGYTHGKITANKSTLNSLACVLSMAMEKYEEDSMMRKILYKDFSTIWEALEKEGYYED